jgi:hypothetical protein
VANQLQSNWKEFDKSRAEKSISRIITGGVLLEHSDVSVPCNADAELISVCKGMNLDGKVCKQLGWEMKDGIIVKAETPADPVPCVCDECGYVADAVVGSRCPECKTGDMKPKAKEKAIEVRVISKGDVPGHEFHGNQHTGGAGGGGETDPNKSPEAQTEREHLAIRTRLEIDNLGNKLGRIQNNIKNDVPVSSEAVRSLRDKAAGVRETMRGISTTNQNPHRAEEYRSDLSMAESILEEADALLDEVGEKGFHSHAVEKPNPHMPGGSFSACVLLMEDKGHETESAKKICGALQADAGGKGLTKAETKAVEEVTGVRKAAGIPCACDECGVEEECAPGTPCQEADCEGVMRPVKGEKKVIVPVVKVFRPAPSVKVLFVPPSSSEIAQRVGDAVEKALSRRTGRIL